MKTNLGPIIIVEDDLDDQELLADAFKALNCTRQANFFVDGYAALNFIESSAVAPFLILSDINMPRMNGFELRKKIRNSASVSVRSIPFVFFTTGADRAALEAVYLDSVQGFFIKPNSMGQLQAIVKKVLDYWEECFSPEKPLHVFKDKPTDTDGAYIV